MDDLLAKLFHDYDSGRISRRKLLRTLGVAAIATPVAAALSRPAAMLGQGACRDGYGQGRCPLSKDVATEPIKPIFAPTGWQTAALDHLSFDVADPRTEAAFYVALMGWKPRAVDDNQIVLDMGDWGTAIFKKAPADRFAAPARAAAAPTEGEGGGGRAGRGGRGQRAPARVAVTGFAWVIDKWNAKTVEGELKKRGLSPVADNGPNGFESFHVKDPDGFDVQIANANGFVKARKTPARAELGQAPPFDSTGWKTVWLDHLSFGVTNYKESTSFYSNLLGWKPTYDEGSQVEVMIGNVGDTIIRGGNPSNPNFSQTARTPVHIDHISFGISPWDTDGVKAELTKRGLSASIDVSSAHPDPSGKTDPNTGRPVMVSDDIHTAAFRSYHTGTPNGYNLQISWMNLERRQNLANAVKPKDLG